ncbi:MAG: HNH endonuclease [Bacillota bacterium]
MGSKNPNYRGGRSYDPTRISRERRSRIKARDGFRCVRCRRAGKELDPRGVQLDVHHLIAVRDGGPDQDANLVTLCRRCHNRIEHRREKLIWPRPTQSSPPSDPPMPPASDHDLSQCDPPSRS